jgi:hypothetical protein
MDFVAQKIHELREQLESAAFLVAQPTEYKAAHKEIVKALISLAELRIAYERTTSSKVYKRTTSSKSSGTSDAEEINKVKRRLKLWAYRPDQINSRILTAYLTLERQGVSPITENDLTNAVGGQLSISSFSSNLLQMRISAERNHGKVFDQNGEKVTLWPPVESVIREYEKLVFDDD